MDPLHSQEAPTKADDGGEEHTQQDTPEGEGAEGEEAEEEEAPKPEIVVGGRVCLCSVQTLAMRGAQACMLAALRVGMAHYVWREPHATLCTVLRVQKNR